MIYVGIDPGARGGVVALLDDKSVVVCEPMPVIDIGVKKRKGKVGKKHIVDGSALARILSGIASRGGVFVVLERAQAMPLDGAVNAFEYGRGFGVIEGVLSTLQIPYAEERPQAWQKIMLKGIGGADTKAQARMLVQREAPHIPVIPLRCRVPDAGLVDAAVIALYAIRTRSVTNGSTPISAPLAPRRLAPPPVRR